MLEVARSARFTSWGNAALAGRVSPDAAGERIVGGDVVHRLAGLPGEAAPVSLPFGLARLRAAGVAGLRLVLPVPGDSSGLPGPAGFTAAAVAAGEAVLTVGGPAESVPGWTPGPGAVPDPGLPGLPGLPGPPGAAGLALGLVPQVTPYAGPLGRGIGVRWVAQPVAGAAWGLPTLAEADRELKEALAHATSALLAMDVARWRPELADAVAQLREDRELAGVLAPGYPPRAAAVLSLARRVGAIATLAGGDDGAAVSASAMARRMALLRELAAAGRRAQVAAYNAVLEPARS